MEIITSDHRMQEVIQLAKTVAASKATILIQGESGTGKELIANLVHEHSTRAEKDMVAINCAAIPDNLIESELFGYEKGSFTGALGSKCGKFELAQGSTLLLDEISEIDIRLQAKLLRAIQEKQIDRIGGSKPIALDVRIIAATNKNLAHCVQEGTFREDLFYRLNVVNLTLPPLKDRIGDIEILSNYFIKKFAEKNKKPLCFLSQEVLSILNSHSWPGNVRELENTIERALIVAQEDVICSKDVMIIEKIKEKEKKTSIQTRDSTDSNWAPGKTLDDIEREVIIDALSFHHGNRTHTANSLGISIRTLRNKIADYKKLGIHL